MGEENGRVGRRPKGRGGEGTKCALRFSNYFRPWSGVKKPLAGMFD